METAEGEGVSVVTSRIGGILVAIRAPHVLEITDGDRSQSSGTLPQKSSAASTLDLARVLELPTASAADHKLLLIATAHGPRPLRFGSRVQITVVPRDEFWDLPPYLSGASSHGGVIGLFRAGAELGYLIDVERVLRLASAESNEGK